MKDDWIDLSNLGEICYFDFIIFIEIIVYNLSTREEILAIY